MLGRENRRRYVGMQIAVMMNAWVEVSCNSNLYISEVFLTEESMTGNFFSVIQTISSWRVRVPWGSASSCPSWHFGLPAAGHPLFAPCSPDPPSPYQSSSFWPSGVSWPTTSAFSCSSPCELPPQGPHERHPHQCSGRTRSASQVVHKVPVQASRLLLQREWSW